MIKTRLQILQISYPPKLEIKGQHSYTGKKQKIGLHQNTQKQRNGNFLIRLKENRRDISDILKN